MLLRRPGVDPRAVLARLDAGLADATLTEIGEGWDNIAYAVDGRLLLRIGKHAAAAERRRVAEQDVALLALAGRHSSLPTNEVVAVDGDEGALLVTLVEGEPAEVNPPRDPVAFADTMAAFLTRLHTVPAVEVAGVLEPDRPQSEWLAETAAAWHGVRDPFDVADQRLVETFLSEPAPEPARRLVFCHNDLREEHILLTEGGGAVCGVIDWSDAVLGDPARDLALLWLDFGQGVFDRVLESYAGPREADLRQRTRWFAARAGVEGLSYDAGRRHPGLGRVLTAVRPLLAEARS